MSSIRPDPDTFLAGDAGDVTDPWRSTKRRLGELAYEALDTLSGTRRRAARLARSATPQRDVLVIGVYRPGSLLAEALPALLSERHRVRIALGSTGPADEPLREHTVAENLDGGKFENLNRLLEAAGPETPDWTIAIDDDVRVPRAFLDRFVGCARRSSSTWRSPRRRCAAIRPGRSRGGGRPRSCARPASSRSARSRRSGAQPPPSCCRSPSSATAGGSTSTGPRLPRSAAGGWAWSTRCRAPRVRRRGRGLRAGGRRGGGGALPRRPPLPAERARGRRRGRAPKAEVLTCGFCSSAPTCAPVEPSATGQR